jgi:hypothetical protein
LGVTNHIYTSPDYIDIQLLAAYFADWGCSYVIQEGPLLTINVSVPWDTITDEDFFISQYASEQWEIIPQQSTKSLIYQGLLVNTFETAADGNLQVLPVTIQGALQNAIANNQATFILPSASSATTTCYSTYATTAQMIFQYTRAGIEGVPVYTQTLKRTAVIDIDNVESAFQTEIDDYLREINSVGNVSAILSTEDMQASYSINTKTVGQLMLPSYSKIYGITGLDPVSYYVYAGWLAKPATIQFIGRNKMQLQQEFLWDEWAAGLYFIASPASDFPLRTMPTPCS